MADAITFTQIGETGLYTLESSKVKVFPSAYRGTDSSTQPFDPEAKLNTEFNYTHIPGYDPRDSYILNWETEGSNPYVEFVIHGYYFKVSGLASRFLVF